MPKPKWSILIATVSTRNGLFVNLVEDVLLPQVEGYGGAIEVLAYWDNFEEKLGDVRNKLVAGAKGEYVSFIDDDDRVPEYYCDEVFPLLDGVDYVGWRMQLYNAGEKAKPTYHSLRYATWDEDENGYYRNTSHVNPIKRSIALAGDFSRSVPDDVDWALQVLPLTKTEHYIEKVMYNYLHDPETSLWIRQNKPLETAYRPIIKHPNFRWHPDSQEESHFAGSIKLDKHYMKEELK